MTDMLLGALALSFAGSVGVNTVTIGKHNYSALTHKVAWIVIPSGVLSVFLSLVLFVSDQGLPYGVIYWGISGFAFACLGLWLMDGIRSILGLGAFCLGVLWAIRAVL